MKTPKFIFGFKYTLHRRYDKELPHATGHFGTVYA
jgi:hypothetical protein